MSRKRAVLAGLLSLIYPGLGHAYLRAWLRALGWFGIALATVSLVVPDSTYRTIETVEIGVLLEAARTLPREAVGAILVMRALNVVDAVWLGLQPGHRVDGDAPPTCPECGGELDDEIDFCPWCTRVLPRESDAG